MEKRIKALSTAILKAKGRRDVLQAQRAEAIAHLEEMQTRDQDSGLAKALVLTTAEKTQANIGQRISSLVSLALAAVFDDPYEFQVEFVQRRGSTEADLWFVRNENKLEPLSCAGGGAVDVASLALRIAIWSLMKTKPVFILDEPFRNLSADLHSKAGLMLQELSRKLGLQFIMVSHNEAVIDGADKVFRLEDGRVVEK